MLNLEVVGQPHTTNCVDRMTESQMEREQREARIREELEAEEEDEDLYALLHTARVFTMFYNLWFLSLSFIYPQINNKCTIHLSKGCEVHNIVYDVHMFTISTVTPLFYV